MLGKFRNRITLEASGIVYTTHNSKFTLYSDPIVFGAQVLVLWISSKPDVCNRSLGPRQQTALKCRSQTQ